MDRFVGTVRVEAMKEHPYARIQRFPTGSTKLTALN